MTEAEGVHPVFNPVDSAREGDVVFVHGLGGTSHDTWRHGSEGTTGHFFWPRELGVDLKTFAVWTIGYGAGISKLGLPGMIIEKRAGNLGLKLANAGIGSRPVVFVCHSMGGLVVKALLADSQSNASEDRRQLASMVRGIVFCGTPHRGSAYADAASVLGKFFGGVQAHVKEMRANEDKLDFIHDRFLAWQRQFEVPTESYAESIGLFRRKLIGRPVPLGLVVPRASANTSIADHPLYDISADHLSLVKPASRQDDVYGGTLRFIRRCMAPAVGTRRPGGDTAGASAGRIAESTSEDPEPSPSLGKGLGTEASRPPEFSDLMPRQLLVADVRRALQEAPLVIVGGLSGTGKTYAVSECVRGGEAPSPNTLWYDASQGDSLDSFFNEIGPLFSLTSGSMHSKCKQLCSMLRARDMLLVIDDFQDVDLDSFRPLLNAVMRQAAPSVLLLITQKDSLLSANVPRVIAKRFSKTEVRSYLQHRGVFGMSNLMIDSLVDATDGLPFAVSLFCTLVTAYGENPLELLSHKLHADDAITEWFQRISTQVDESCMQLLRLLSLVGAPFNFGVVRLIADVGGIEDPEGAVRELQRAFLLQRYSPYRLSTHDLVGMRCREMVATEVRDKVYLALSRHFLRGYPRRSPSDLLEPDEFRWKARALDQMLRAEVVPESALRLFSSLVSTAKATGKYAFVINVGDMVKKALPNRDGWIDYHIAHSCLISGLPERAFQMMDELLRSEALTISATLELACRRLLAESLAALGQASKAHERLTSALADALLADASKTTRAQALAQLAVMDLDLGRFAEAKRTGELLLADSAKSGDQRGAAVALSLLGGAEAKQEQVETAMGHFKQAAQLFTQCQDKRGFVWASVQLADCYVRLKDDEAAAPCLLDAVHTAADIGECSADYQSLLERIERTTASPSIRSSIEYELSRISDALLPSLV